MKKLFFVLAASFLLFLTACGNEEAQEETTEDVALTETIRFGLMSAIDAIPFIIAQEQGFFAEAGVTVEIESFQNPRDRDAAFQSGNLDGIISDIVAIGLYNEAEFDARIVGTTTGRFAILGRDEFTSLEDATGREAVISTNTAIEFLMDKMLEERGMSPDDITKVDVPPIPTRLVLLKNNQGDITLVPEPFVTIGIESGLVSLMDTETFVFPTSLIVFTQDAIQAKSNEMIAFLAAYDRAVDFLNTADPADFMDVVIEEVGFPEEVRGKLELPTFQHTSLPDELHVQAAIDWLKEKGLMTKDFTPADFIVTLERN